MAIVTVSVHGQIIDPDTSLPAVGSVTFKTLTDLRDTVANIIYQPGIYTATLDLAGEFTLILPATDSPDVTPTGWLYQVYISTTTWRNTFYISLPAILAPAVEFADLIAVDDPVTCTPDGTACAPISIIAEITALQEQVADLTLVVDGLAVDVAALDADVTALQADVTTLQTDLATLTVTVGALVGQVNTISPIVLANQAAITVIQGQITTIQGQITTLQGQVGTLQTDLAALAANAVLLNPTSAGVYNGNTFTTPPNPAGVQPWLKSNVIPYSAADSNFDIVRFRAQDEFGNTVNTGTYNGNGEGRDRPSSRSRVARRTFESAEAVGGSTQQYVQWSSDATIAANREPFLGGWGSANATKPGWVEATRVLSGLAGVSIGGTVNAALAPYSTLTPFIYRGLRATPGPPTVGTWLLNDVVLDSAGVVYRCTVAGAPGTWVGVNAPTAYTNMTPGVNMSLDANYPAATRLDRGGDDVRLCGTLVANAGIPSGNVIATVTAAHRPSSALRPKTFIVRTTSGGARGRVTSAGDYTLNAALILNDNVWCDSITYDQL